MGVMVPSAVRLLGAAASPLVPWGWGVNGATSVVGTSLATITAMYGGFTATFLLGAVCYAVAGLLGTLVARHHARAAAAPSAAPASPAAASPAAASSTAAASAAAS